MLNIEKYKDEIEKNDACIIYEKITGKPFNRHDTMNWLCAEYKEPILDDVEREYLKAVCKPFRNKMGSVQKYNDRIKGTSQFLFIILENERFSLPSFKKGTMYKNMELYKPYTLEELGITYDDEVKNTTITNNGTLNIKL